MKNIYAIPTDKPSRLHYSKVKTENKIAYKLILKSELSKCNDGLLSGQRNIYITSDEEIKEGDWCIDNRNTLNKIINVSTNGYLMFENGNSVKDINCKKIILTTDQSLDGVQAISDEFLEWFVKNPSCEEVEVEEVVVYDDNNYGSGEIFHSNKKLEYKIIIPKEETLEKEWLKTPKWGVRLNKDKLPDFTYVDCWYEGVLYKRNMLQLVYPNSPSFGGLNWKVFETKELAEKWIKNPIIPKEEPNKETLEQAAESYAKPFDNRFWVVATFKDGAKWQQERMYSEEEVMSILINSLHSVELKDNKNYSKIYNGMKEWFEQFKKK